MVSQDVNDFLNGGGGGKAAKFEKHGDKVSGFVTSAVLRQQTDFKTKAPMTWPDGNPRMQLVVTLFTDEHDDDDDDGMRTVYIRGQMQKAVGDAVKKSGQQGLAEGGRLAVEYFDTAAPKVRGENGAKQYRARYEAPQVRVPVEGDDGIDPDDLPF